MKLPGLLLVFLAPHRATGLHSNFLSHNDIIEFIANGHVYLKDMLPQLREESFRVAHNYARDEASKAYERYSIEKLGCNETAMDYLTRVENGDGALALKDCFEYAKDNRHEQSKPFYQLVDLHEHSKAIAEIAMGEHIASIAADLLQVDRVRLFQTRTFRKVPQKDKTMEQIFNHATYMHTDLKMVPIDTNQFFTFWCPLRNVTSEDSVLTYARGSHRDASSKLWYGNASPRQLQGTYEPEREEEVKFWKKKQCPKEPQDPFFEFEEPEEPACKIPPLHVRRGLNERFQHKLKKRRGESQRIETEYSEINGGGKDRYDIDIYDKINLGDCVAHHGWLLHGATSQRSSSGPREAIALSYVHADDYKLLSKEDREGIPFLEDGFEDEIVFWQWYYDVKDGAIIDHPKLPLVWPPQSKGMEPSVNETNECDSTDNTESLEDDMH